MAIRWQIPFRTLRSNSLLTVNVYDNSYNGSPTQLTGGAQPFVTEEDDDDDWFAPVRTQSGYLSIVDTGKDNDGNPFNWRDFIPTTDTDRPVTLTDEQGTILWQGFMQAQNFGSQLYEIPQERQIPVQCVLTVLSAKQMGGLLPNTDIRSFGSLLNEILLQIPTLTVNDIIVQDRFELNKDSMEWLFKKVCSQLFYDSDDDGHVVGKYTYFELLEEICKYWGLTARTHRQTIYFIKADDKENNALIYFTREHLENSISLGIDAVTSKVYDFSEKTIGDDFASTENNDMQMRGPSKAVVTADVGSDSKLVTAFPDSVMTELYKTGFNRSGLGNIYRTSEITSFNTGFLTGNCVNGNASFAILCQVDNGGEGQNHKVYDFTYNFSTIIRMKNVADNNVKASIETTFCYVFTRGAFTIRGTVMKENAEFQDPVEGYQHGSKSMGMRIGIGMTRSSAVWWDGGDWVSTQTTFNATIGNTGDIIYTAKQGAIMSAVKKRIDVGVNDFFHGKIFIDFLGSRNIDEDASKCVFDIMDFSIEYERTRNMITPYFVDTERRDSYSYKAKNDNITKEEWSTDTFFATENFSRFGYGIVLNSDYKYYAPEEGKQPEQQLADRVVDYWATSKRKVECELMTDEVEKSEPITPRDLLTIDGTTMWPIAISHDWRDDVTRITAMETYKR